MKEEIRQRLDIREVVAEYVALKPSGANKFKGLSPFSKEKTPSFYVDTAKQLFYCFSTKTGGDVFKFVQLVEGITFREALEKLASKAGVALEPTSGVQDKRKRDLFEVNAFAAQYFKSQLPNSEALAYLQRRGVTDASIEMFGLGYAPNGFDNLLKYAKARGLNERELLEAGLLAEAQDTGRIYDRFRGRVMFPIKDYLGRVVAFGGRVLDDSKPKYLNSPETEIFKKHDTLYGLELARKHIQETGNAVVVEGYMDVIAMHQHGLTGAVASLGTALTPDHANLLTRQGVRRLTLLFDNDAAGERATIAGLDGQVSIPADATDVESATLSRLQEEIGRQFFVKVVLAPGGKDAADILLAGGKNELEEALQGGLSEVKYRLETVVKKFAIETLDGKRGALQALLPFLRPRGVFDPVALELRRLVEDRLQLEPKMLDQFLNANRPKGQNIDRMQMSGLSRSSGGDEIKLAKLLVQNPGLTAKLDGEAMFENPLVAELIEVARTATSSQQILEHFMGRPEASMLFEGVFTAPDQALESKDEDFAVVQISSRQREDTLRQELAALKAQIPKAPPEQQLILAKQCGDLQRAMEAERRSRLRA